MSAARGFPGVRLQLRLGRSTLRPAPADVMTSLVHAEVILDERAPGGFELRFSAAKSRSGAVSLVRSGLLDPEGHVAVGVSIGARSFPLVRGVIHHRQVAPAEGTGVTVTVMGRDLTGVMALRPHVDAHEGLTDSEMVAKVLKRYVEHGLSGDNRITATDHRPDPADLVPTQSETDLQFVRRLARRNGFVFYLEPRTLTTVAAYWGKAECTGPPQPDLVTNFSFGDNVVSIHLVEDPLAPTSVEAYTIDERGAEVTKVPEPREPADRARGGVAPLAARTSTFLRAAHLSPADARTAAAAVVGSTPDAVRVDGTIDTASYGGVLQPHRRVNVRGLGRADDGEYEVRRVHHQLAPGRYEQSFVLGRAGRAA